MPQCALIARCVLLLTLLHLCSYCCLPIFTRSDPTLIPWKDAGVDYVIESTGVFTDIAKVGLG